MRAVGRDTLRSRALLDARKIQALVAVQSPRSLSGRLFSSIPIIGNTARATRAPKLMICLSVEPVLVVSTQVTAAADIQTRGGTALGVILILRVVVQPSLFGTPGL